MARTVGPVCRLCRREGMKLFLKGMRCHTAKCPIERQWRNVAPGMHAWRRGRKPSPYAVRLREKQKIKRYYGVWERQFILYFKRAERMRQNTGTALLALLERRLDNVVFSLGLAPSRKSARITIVHGHIRVNGRRTDRPSFLVNAGDVVSLKPSEKTKKFIRDRMELDGGLPQPQWLALNPEQLEGTVVSLPTRDDVKLPVEEQLIVEMCSR